MSLSPAVEAPPSTGPARDFAEMIGRLAAYPDGGFSYYAAGAVVRKSFPEVLQDVLQAKSKLQSWGVVPGMRVGILATNSYPWIVHDLALILLRVTTFPLADETPTAELPSIFERYRLNLLLASSDLLPDYPLRQPIAFLDRDDAARPVLRTYGAPAADDDPDREITPSIVLSSGSSGKVKALKVSDTGSMRVIAYYCSRYRFRADDSLLVFLPLHSYQQRLMIYGCIDRGVSVALVGVNQIFQGLRDFSPTLCLAPPILFESVHKQFEDGVRRLPLSRRLAFRAALALGKIVPVAGVRRACSRLCYGKLRASFGGRIRLLWTGMAPIKRNTLDLFAAAGLPLVETYGLTESGPIACNTLEENRIGSVGKPIVPGSVRLAEDGEIIVERDAFLTTGYHECDPAEEAATYLSPSRIATGDIGRFDADGFLYIKGRKKEAIITAEGLKIHPELVEDRLNRSPLVLQSVVFGNGLPHLAAVLVVRQPEADRDEIGRWIEEVHRHLPHGVQIARHHLTGEEFSKGNGGLTENLKLNRRAIFERYARNLV